MSRPGIKSIPGAPGFAEESDEAFHAITADPNLISYVSLAQRPGLMEWLQALEYDHYPPDTPRNDLFNIRIKLWEGIQWVIVTIPMAERGTAEEVMARHGLRATPDGILMISGAGRARFPLSGDNVFTLQAA